MTTWFGYQRTEKLALNAFAIQSAPLSFPQINNNGSETITLYIGAFALFVEPGRVAAARMPTLFPDQVPDGC
jgi:hypothetical protein